MLLTFPIISQAQNSNFSLYFYNSLKQRKSEQFTNYAINPFNNWQLRATGRNLEDNRLDFNQTSVNSSLNLVMTNNNSFLSHNLQTGYEYLYDHSNLESELNPYLNKTGYLGYGLQMSPLDSLVLYSNCKAYYRQEQDRYKANHEFISQGLLEQVNARYLLGNQSGNLSFSGNWENKHLDWEAYQQTSTGIASYLERDDFMISAFVNASMRNEDLYLLAVCENPDSTCSSYYNKYDKQLRRNLDTNVNVAVQLGTDLNCQLSEQYSFHDYHHKINKLRNTGDYNNLTQLRLSYQLSDNVLLQSENSSNYYIKDLSYVKNSRIIDVRYTNNSLIWNYNPYDSVSVYYTVELRRTDYPDSGQDLDNDYLNKLLRLNWTVFWKDRIRVSNKVAYSTKDEIFLNATLSANNNTVTGLQWQPECDVLIGDCFLMQQEYQIRADYDNYYYNSFSNINDTFYRQLLASYHLVYDSTPLISKLTTPKWSLLPFRKRNTEAVRIDLGYSWEQSETSSQDGDIYYVNGEIKKQNLSCAFQKQYDVGIYQIMPKYSWGTWKEYSLLVSAIWQLNQNSVAEINLNPVGESISALDWRISCSVNLFF